MVKQMSVRLSHCMTSSLVTQERRYWQRKSRPPRTPHSGTRGLVPGSQPQLWGAGQGWIYTSEAPRLTTDSTLILLPEASAGGNSVRAEPHRMRLTTV